jgi:hypothetical protein
MIRGKNAFEIFYDETSNIVTLRLSGDWDREVGEIFEREFQATLKEVHINRKHWHLLLDLTGCIPQSQAMQDIVSRALLSAKIEGMKGKAVLAKCFIPLFQTTSLSRDPALHIDFYFQSEDEAIRWLLHQSSIKEFQV